MRPKAELVRLVRRANGMVVPEVTGLGRGAYVCPGPACLQRAVKLGRLPQAFRKPCVVGPGLSAVQ